MDHHHLDLFILPHRDPGHQRDDELEFGLVGVHDGVWDSVVLGVPEAQVHGTYHYFRAIRQGLKQSFGRGVQLLYAVYALDSIILYRK